MNTLLYRLGTGAYHAAIQLGSVLGVRRARQWTDGRKNQPPVPADLHRGRPLIWMHCASLGEWEQGRPVMAAFRKRHPEYRALLTFYSPSGYDRCRNEPSVDHVAYLPADTPKKAKAWVRQVRPALAVFVKYEFWFFHLRALSDADVPTFLVAASFRAEQPFFRATGGWWRALLGSFSGVVVQQRPAAELLTGPGNYPEERVCVAGDPRMDRTLELADQPFEDDIVAAFTAGVGPVIVAGSVWPEDTRALWAAWAGLSANTRIILAPHQLQGQEIARAQVRWEALRYTETTPEEVTGARVLILDTIGILSRVYRYGDVAYVGGAFRTGLHNTLEPLAYELPVVFGPQHRKFPEAAAMIAAGGGFSVQDGTELGEVLQRLLRPEERAVAAGAQVRLARQWAGAAERTVTAVDAWLA